MAWQCYVSSTIPSFSRAAGKQPAESERPHALRLGTSNSTRMASSVEKGLPIMDNVTTTLFNQLVVDVECPVSHFPLYSAVTLLPCSHKVNLHVAETFFGNPASDGSLSTERGCPTCQIKVETYCPDPKMSALARVVIEAKMDRWRRDQTYLEDMLSVAGRFANIDSEKGYFITRVLPISGFSKKIYEEICCPIMYTNLTTPVTLFPCGHKLNEECIQGLLRIQENKSIFCPICRSKVRRQYPDKVMSAFVEKVLAAKAEKRQQESQSSHMLQDVALQLANNNNDTAARDVVQIITCKKVRASTLLHVEKIQQTISIRLSEQARSLADRLMFREAEATAASITRAENKREALHYVFEVEQREREAAHERARQAMERMRLQSNHSSCSLQ